MNSIHRLLARLTLIFTLFATAAPLARAQSDTAPPAVESVTFTPSGGDITAGPVSVTVTARFTDALSGVNFTAAVFASPSGAQEASAYFNASNRVSGTAQDGVYESTLQIPRYAEAGEWRILRFYVADVAGNAANLYRPGIRTPVYPAALDLPLQVTTDVAPNVSDTGLTGLTATGATANGSVNPRGLGTTWRVEFGPTAALGQSSASLSVGNGTALVPVSHIFSGLSPGQTVHYRFAAQNGNGTNYTPVAHFTTPNTAPMVAVTSMATNTFSNTGSMAQARIDHTATLLLDGKVLVVGGEGSSTSTVAELYNPTTGSWSGTGALAAGRQNHTATRLPNGKVLVAGGIRASFPGGNYAEDSMASAELYDPATQTWSSAGSMASERFDHTAALLPDGKVLVIAGRIFHYPSFFDQTVADAEIYDPATNSWSPAGALARGRSQFAAAVLVGGKVLVAGGYGPAAGGYMPHAEIYDPTTNTWSSAGSMSAGRGFGPTATRLANGKVLVAGGYNDNGLLATAELYDPAMNVWSPAASFSVARNNHAAELLPDGRVLIVGGDPGPVQTTSAQLYDPATNAWSAAGSLSIGSRNLSATLLASGNVIVVGGQGNSNAGTRAEIFDSSLAATATEGAPATMTGTFSDADGNATVTLSASTGTVTQDNGAGTWSWTATGADGPATSTVTITATDSASATATATFAFTVTNVVPTVAITAAATANEDTAVSFDLTAMDASTADQAAGFEWALDFGDGTTEAVVAGTASPLARTHTFAEPGTYNVTATATDKDSGVSTVAMHEITVLTVVLDPVSSALYTKGGIVPGAGSDPRIPTGALFTQFFPPAINEEGKVAFVAKWKAGMVSSGGVFVDGALVAALGEATSISGTIWKAFKDPVIGRTGKVAFLATIGGAGVTTANDTVVATNLSGSLEIVAQEQAVAAGTGGALWKAFLGVSLAPRFSGGGVPEPDEELLFKGTLFVGGGTPTTAATNDSAVASYDSSSLTVGIVLREGVTQMSDGALSQVFGAPTVKTFSLFTALSGSPGQGGQHVSLAGGVTGMKWTSAAGLQALTTADGRLNSYIVGQHLGGTTIPDALFLALNPPRVGRWESAVGQPVVAAVRAKLIAGTTGVTTTTNNGIFASADSYQNWEPIARQGGTAPGTDGLFKTFKDPVLASNHRGLAFSGAVGGGTVTLADDAAIWWQPDGGALTLVAREGMLPVGAPVGAVWKAFDSLALPGGATGPLFTATLLQGPGGITALDDAALYGVDSLGALRELMRENQPLLGKTVKTFTVLKAATGSPGVARSFNSAGEVVSLVTFTDTTPAIVKTVVP